MRHKKLEGMTFGSLYVVGVAEVSRSGHYKYHVRCDCGVEKTVLGTHLLQGNTTHCGCQKRKPRNWKGCGTVSMTYFTSLLRGAKGGKGRKPLPFEVTIEYLSYLLDEKQKGKCALTGMPITVFDHTASVDRIDSSKGYVKGNLQWVHKDINMMKRHYSMEYFKHLCALVTKGSCEIVDLT